MLSPTIVAQNVPMHRVNHDDFIAYDHALCYIPALDEPTMRHEREVYEADPLGGSPSRY